MSEIYGIVKSEHCYIYREPGTAEGLNKSEVTDELFSGWAVRLLTKTDNKVENAQQVWIKIETHYGYCGYVNEKDLCIIDERELVRRQEKARFKRIRAAEADLLDRADVRGRFLELLLKNAVVEVRENGENVAGWVKVRAASGREGYIRSVQLIERKDDDRWLLQSAKTESSEAALQSAKTESSEAALQSVKTRPSEAVLQSEKTRPSEAALHSVKVTPGEVIRLREKLVESALSYLGTQYRWGGKSSQGIDCSGLVFMSYLENGILIFRDAEWKEGYPMHRILREDAKPGDAIYFPGHMAMYLGADRYIHATASADAAGVVINSLDPQAEDYREDLAKKLLFFGSIF